MSLVRTGSAAVVGVASRVLTPPTVAPLKIGTTTVEWATVAEATALIGGSVLQFVAPFTLPNVVDGLVDGAAALLASRATNWAIKQTAPTTGAWVGYQANPNVGAAAYGGLAAPCARGAVGSVGQTPKRELV